MERSFLNQIEHEFPKKEGYQNFASKIERSFYLRDKANHQPVPGLSTSFMNGMPCLIFSKLKLAEDTKKIFQNS